MLKVKHYTATSVSQTSHGVTVIAIANKIFVILQLIKMGRALKFTGWKKKVERISITFQKAACHRAIVVERIA